MIFCKMSSFLLVKKTIEKVLAEWSKASDKRLSLCGLQLLAKIRKAFGVKTNLPFCTVIPFVINSIRSGNGLNPTVQSCESDFNIFFNL